MHKHHKSINYKQHNQYKVMKYKVYRVSTKTFQYIWECTASIYDNFYMSVRLPRCVPDRLCNFETRWKNGVPWKPRRLKNKKLTVLVDRQTWVFHRGASHLKIIKRSQVYEIKLLTSSYSNFIRDENLS